MPGNIGQLRQLGHKDQYCQGVDKAGDHRAGDKTHQRAKPQITGNNLEDPGQQCCGQQVLQAVLLHQRHHQHCHGGGSGRNHPRAAAHNGDNHGNTERRIEADPRIDTGDNGKGDSFGNQCQCHDRAGEQIATDIAQPVFFG